LDRDDVARRDRVEHGGGARHVDKHAIRGHAVLRTTAALRRPLSAEFGPTSWTCVLQAARGGNEAESAREAWHRLATQYWRPLYLFCRKKGDPPEVAKDHVQSFFASLLERDQIAGADPARGRFRNWLMAAIQQHRQRTWRRDHAQCRHPERGFDPREISDIEGVLALEGDAGPDAAFLRQWALGILDQARNALESRYKARGDAERFEHFWARLLPGASEADHGALARELGMTSGALATALWKFRQEYQRTLRKVVRETIPQGDDVDAEVRELVRAVS